MKKLNVETTIATIGALIPLATGSGGVLVLSEINIAIQNLEFTKFN
jgi:hypothetical protein